MGMVEAYGEAAKAYAAEIGRVYAKLKAGLPTTQATVLIEGQRSWQTYLKAQRKLTSYVYDADGTIHKPMAMQLLKETLQHRLTELCGFFLRIGPDPNSEDVPGNGDWCTEEHQDLEGPDFLASASRAEGLPHQAGQKP